MIPRGDSTQAATPGAKFQHAVDWLWMVSPRSYLPPRTPLPGVFIALVSGLCRELLVQLRCEVRFVPFLPLQSL